jgi:hypothetical protein
MKRVLALGLFGGVLLAACSPAQARLIASDEESGRIPTVGIGVTITNPKPPRIEVRAQPPDRVKIKQDVECIGRSQSRSKGRQIHTKPPFSGRIALTLTNPKICIFVVVAQYVEATGQGGHLKTGTVKLRLYH